MAKQIAALEAETRKQKATQNYGLHIESWSNV